MAYAYQFQDFVPTKGRVVASGKKINVWFDIDDKNYNALGASAVVNGDETRVNFSTLRVSIELPFNPGSVRHSGGSGIYESIGGNFKQLISKYSITAEIADGTEYDLKDYSRSLFGIDDYFGTKVSSNRIDFDIKNANYLLPGKTYNIQFTLGEELSVGDEIGLSFKLLARPHFAIMTTGAALSNIGQEVSDMLTFPWTEISRRIVAKETGGSNASLAGFAFKVSGAEYKYREIERKLSTASTATSVETIGSFSVKSSGDGGSNAAICWDKVYVRNDGDALSCSFDIPNNLTGNLVTINFGKHPDVDNVAWRPRTKSCFDAEAVYFYQVHDGQRFFFQIAEGGGVYQSCLDNGIPNMCFAE